MSTQAQIDMVVVGRQAVVLQRTWSRCEMSTQAQRDTEMIIQAQHEVQNHDKG